ncbi:MAG: T3SS (YopN, CesT) and YbjN peptide-binding chaperone 1 [Candidatus Kapaibacteriales bacterium]
MNENKFLSANLKESYQQTPQDLIDKTIADLEKLLDEHFPEHIKFDGTFTVQRGSSQIMIIVRPFTIDDACIEFYSNVVTGAKITNDLMHFLLRKNAELHFGSFGIIFDNTITFSHSIIASSLNQKTLSLILNSLALICDYYDDIIVNIAGGKRASDLTYDLENE